MSVLTKRQHLAVSTDIWLVGFSPIIAYIYYLLDAKILFTSVGKYVIVFSYPLDAVNRPVKLNTSRIGNHKRSEPNLLRVMTTHTHTHTSMEPSPCFGTPYVSWNTGWMFEGTVRFWPLECSGGKIGK